LGASSGYFLAASTIIGLPAAGEALLHHLGRLGLFQLQLGFQGCFGSPDRLA